MKRITACLLMALSIATCGLAAENPLAYMHQRQTDTVIYYNKKSKAKRSEITYTLQRNAGDRSHIYTLAIQGKGNYDKFNNITWDIRAYMEEKNGLLYPLHIRCGAKDIQGRPFISFEKEFDYARKRIFWRQRDAMGNIMKEIRFPLKGITTDDVTLVHFLKAFAAGKTESGLDSFYLITNEPRMYKIKIKYLGTQMLTLCGQGKRALQLKLNPDIGFLDNMLGKYLPQTYVWLGETSPHDWVQYEGLETGLYSATVTACVQNRQTQ